MATERVCNNTITLYNYAGEDADHRAVYYKTVLDRIHVLKTEGVSNSDVASDTVHVHIFDDMLATEKPFLPYEQWKDAPDKAQYWTLHDGGKDYIATESRSTSGTSLPTEHPLFKVTHIARRQRGSHRMWHWRLDAR